MVKVKCKECGGTGRQTCYDCDGVGNYGDGEVCGLCSGESEIECESCSGLGMEQEELK